MGRAADFEARVVVFNRTMPADRNRPRLGRNCKLTRNCQDWLAREAVLVFDEGGLTGQVSPKRGAISRWAEEHSGLSGVSPSQPEPFYNGQTRCTEERKGRLKPGALRANS